MLRTGGLACVRSTRFLVGPSRLSAAHPLALLTSSRTSQRPGWGAAGSSRGLCAAPEVSPKIQALVDQISELTLLEASELTDALKEKLGISGAMMMPAGGGGPAPAAAAAEQEEAAPEKLIFTIKLAKFDAATKIKLIKEVRPAQGRPVLGQPHPCLGPGPRTRGTPAPAPGARHHGLGPEGGQGARGEGAFRRQGRREEGGGGGDQEEARGGGRHGRAPLRSTLDAAPLAGSCAGRHELRLRAATTASADLRVSRTRYHSFHYHPLMILTVYSTQVLLGIDAIIYTVTPGRALGLTVTGR